MPLPSTHHLRIDPPGEVPGGGDPGPHRAIRRGRSVLGVLVLSGAAGLVYEIVWSRQLVLVFGNTSQAVSTILTGFFGGMALGSLIGGRIADRVRSPLRLYGMLELALALVVLATPWTFGVIREVYRGLYPALLEWPGLLALVRVGLALVALGPATVLMGATLPTLVRQVGPEPLGHTFGRLYAANTIGAILGTALAGLVLIELAGLTGALRVGAGCSGVAGLLALLLSRGAAPAPGRLPEPPGAGEPRQEAADGVPGGRQRTRMALLLAFASGLTSLGYQVLWLRLLASGTGNTTYVFTFILAIFLLGIALGAVLFNTLRPRLRDPLAFFAATQILAAALVMAGLVGVLIQPRTLDPGQPLSTLVALTWSSLLVVLPAATVLGLAFPAAAALLDQTRSRVGERTGSLLAVNTAGAITGSLIIPFWLVPWLGSPRVLALLALVSAALAVALAGGHRRIRIGGGVMAALALGAAIAPGLLVQPHEAVVRQAGGRIFESAEDEIASVQAGQIRSGPELWVAGASMTLLTIDAKLMPILPLIARPAARRSLVVAFGMGSSFRSALIAGLQADGVELVPSVPRMFRHYYADAAAVLAHPAGRVIVADGRNHLELTDRRFDIIATDPPPPIEGAGVSVIASLEYYQAGRAHLNPGGVMLQFVGYRQSPWQLKAQVRTFAAVFPQVAMVRSPGRYGIYLLGSHTPFQLDPASIASVLSRPGVLPDLASAHDSPARDLPGWIDVLAKSQWLRGEAVRTWAGPGPLITDDRPLPEYFLLRRLFAR